MKPDGDDETTTWPTLALEESGKGSAVARVAVAELKNFRPRNLGRREKGTFRAVEWRDMAVLLRSPSGKAEVYAKEFERAGVPLVVARGGFYESGEILDLLSLLQLLDNPLQDVPVIAVLRSPLVGCSLDELAEIRLAAGRAFLDGAQPDSKSKAQSRNDTQRNFGKFLERFHRWRQLARQVSSLSQCLEERAGGNALRRLAAIASARRTAAGERRAVSQPGAAV
jgi:ATP-dependent exoDNAse (exonuclease V) beta subunit